MTEYEYNLTFTFEPKKNTTGQWTDSNHPIIDKQEIDDMTLEFMKTLVMKNVREMNYYVSEKEKIN